MPTDRVKGETEGEKLYVVDVIPIVSGLPKSTLSYFTRENVSPGSFVNITIKSREALGLVSRVRMARDLKSNLRRSHFALKKLEKSKKTHGLSKEFIRATELTADYYATSVGKVLRSLIPQLALESPELFGSHYVSTIPQDARGKSEPLLLQLNDEERLREYKTIIRGAFARSHSVLVIAPTNEDALRIFDVLSQGISEYTYTTAGKTPKNIISTLQKIQADPHPILLISTPIFTFFDRHDLHTIILERENSRLYHTHLKPGFDLKIFLEHFTSLAGKTLIYGDSVLSLRSLWLEKQGRYAEFSPLKWRLHPETEAELVDMKVKKGESQSEFHIFSPELRLLIEQAIKEKRKLFLFAVRKGLAPSTACKDCGSILSCTNCESPVVLHQTPAKEKIYVCHACGERRSAETRCDYCSSWNLIPLGIGVQRIKEELEKSFPGVVPTILDKDHAPTRAKARTIAKQFASQKGGIMIGTELALLYLQNIPYVGVISLDSLFSIPDFTINERIFYLITRLLEIGNHRTVLQTRNIKKEILEYAIKGDIVGFYRSEIEERKELFYPPFSLFIKVTITSTDDVSEKTNFLQNLFKDEDPDFVRERRMKTGTTTISMIIRIPRDTWPHKDLLRKLSLLREGFLIKVDPESIL